MANRIIVALTGATGQAYGVRALELLGSTDYEVHLILSEAAKINLNQEVEDELESVMGMADHVHSNKNIGAPTASGSFRTTGMIVLPCSMKTLSNIATGSAANLITRSADVMLKERNPLVLMPREKPFNRIHLKNMLEITDAGGVIFPPFPSFYQDSSSIDEMITRTVARALEHCGVEVEYDEWTGM